MEMTTPLTISIRVESLTKSLEKLSLPLLSWFKEEKHKLNPDKCHLIVSSTEITKFELGKFTITDFFFFFFKKLLHINDRLKLHYHIESLCKMPNLKSSALSHIVPFADLSQKSFVQCLFLVTV